MWKKKKKKKRTKFWLSQSKDHQRCEFKAQIGQSITETIEKGVIHFDQNKKSKNDDVIVLPKQQIKLHCSSETQQRHQAGSQTSQQNGCEWNHSLLPMSEHLKVSKKSFRYFSITLLTR